MRQFIKVTPFINGEKSKYKLSVNVDKIIYISELAIDGRSTLYFDRNHSIEIAETAFSVLRMIADD